MTLLKAANFSLRQFVSILKEEMNNFKIKFEKRKKKKMKINSKNSYNTSSSDLSQTFIDKSIGKFFYFF